MKRLSWIACALFVAAPAIAHAEPWPVETTLERDRSASRLWYFGWSGFYVVATGANIAVALAATDPGLRADARVGAIKSGLGLLATALLPPPSLFHRPCQESSDEAMARCLKQQRERLDDTADAERLGTSWLAHTAAIAVNVGAGSYSWFHDDRQVTSVLATVVGIGVAELQIWTRPTIARDVDTSRWSFGAAPLLGGASFVAARAF